MQPSVDGRDPLGNPQLESGAQSTSGLTLLCGATPTSYDLRIARLSDFMGIPCSIASHVDVGDRLHKAEPHTPTLICSALTISRLLSDSASGQRAWDRLLEQARVVLIYGFQPGQPQASVAARVTNGQISTVRKLTQTDCQYDISSSYPEITAEFTGLSFTRVCADIDFAFVPKPAPTGISPLVSIGGLPFYCRYKQGPCTLFLLACGDVLDISQKTDRTVSVNDTFSRLMPIALFLKFVFGKRVWHSRHRLANLIIDDPLLTRSYGCLKYEDLLAKLDEIGIAASIAFIPWNYKRTDPGVARLFRERTDRLSLCVHGCDHTNAEFASTDLAILNTKVRLASHRMNRHRQCTGIPHCEAMVFPQGQFSLESLKVLQAHNYLAAINSGPLPANRNGRERLTVSDFLQAAITKYSGCPLFMRKYPEQIEQCAFDLFWGKPLLFVEHHTYLRDEYVGLVTFVKKVNSLYGDLTWQNLTDTITNTYDQQVVDQSTVLLRMYANRQIVDNSDVIDKTFVISRSADCDQVPVHTVFADEESMPFTHSNGVLKLSIRVPAGRSVAVRVTHDNTLPYAVRDQSIMTATRTWARRLLSETRDNLLCRNTRTASYFHDRPRLAIHKRLDL